MTNRFRVKFRLPKQKELEARIVIEQWRLHYNAERPHSSLGVRAFISSSDCELRPPWEKQNRYESPEPPSYTRLPFPSELPPPEQH